MMYALLPWLCMCFQTRARSQHSVNVRAHTLSVPYYLSLYDAVLCFPCKVENLHCEWKMLLNRSPCRQQLQKPGPNKARPAVCNVALVDLPDTRAPTDERARLQQELEEVPLAELYEKYEKGYLSIGTDSETDCWVTDVEGTIPPELTGTLLRNGPAMFERDGFKKEFLDGDGMITSLSFKDGRAYFRNKFVRTPGFKREECDGVFSSLSIFTAEDPRPLQSKQPVWKHRCSSACCSAVHACAVHGCTLLAAALCMHAPRMCMPLPTPRVPPELLKFAPGDGTCQA
jgi:hypothetical protein